MCCLLIVLWPFFVSRVLADEDEQLDSVRQAVRYIDQQSNFELREARQLLHVLQAKPMRIQILGLSAPRVVLASTHLRVRRRASTALLVESHQISTQHARLVPRDNTHQLDRRRASIALLVDIVTLLSGTNRARSAMQAITQQRRLLSAHSALQDKLMLTGTRAPSA